MVVLKCGNYQFVIDFTERIFKVEERNNDRALIPFSIFHQVGQ